MPNAWPDRAPGVEPVTLDWEVEAMRLRIFPRDESFFDLFEAAADNMVQSARLLDDLLGDFVDPELKAKRLVECEHEGDRITHAILTWLNSTFITPFDREDIYALAAQLDDVVDAVEETADMLVLHKVEQPIDPVREQARIILQAAKETARGLRHLRKLNLVRLRAYQVAVTELEEEGDRVYRRARGRAVYLHRRASGPLRAGLEGHRRAAGGGAGQPGPHHPHRREHRAHLCLTPTSRESSQASPRRHELPHPLSHRPRRRWSPLDQFPCARVDHRTAQVQASFVLAGRAPDVPQAAVHHGRQRSTAVTCCGP